MTGTTHVAVGAMAGAVMGRLAGTHDPLLVALGAAGGLLPDLDRPGSKAWRSLLLLAPAALSAQYLGLQLSPAIAAPTLTTLGMLLIGLATGHRGATHSLLILAASGVFLILASPGLHSAAFWTGMATHVLADMLTPEGVPLLWPSQSRHSLPVARTGGLSDLLLRTGSLLATALLLR